MEDYQLIKSMDHRANFLKIANRLKNRRAGLTSHYRVLAEYIEPTMPRFFLDDTDNEDWRPSGKILDSTPTQASNILKAGMFAGITPPSRPWFRLGVGDLELRDNNNVKKWLDENTEAMRGVFLKSNFYEQVQPFYGTLGTFGTSCMYVEEDLENVVRFNSQPVGSFFVGINDKYRVDQYFREYTLSVRQLVKKFAFDPDTQKFDWSKVSPWIKDNFEAKNYETRINIGHLVIPNADYKPNKKWSINKKYISVYIEMGVFNTGNANNNDTYSIGGAEHLYAKGYDMFPALTSRWATAGEDSYASNCPGFTSLGDAIQLQEGERKTLKAIDKMIDPPMVGPPALRNQRSSILPNDITYLEETQMAQFRPAHSVNFNIQAMEAKQDQVRQRIIKNYYADLFLMLANSDRRQITATEIEERHEEKLLALGPVLENLNYDFLDPLIDMVFMFMEKQGLISEPPEELRGREIKVEYISIMAQAQKALGLGAIDRVSQFAMGVANFDPVALKKVNFAEAIDEYAEITGAPARMIRSDEEVEEMQAAEQEAQAQAQQVEQMKQVASAGKDLSDSDVSGDNALSRLMTGG